MYKVLYRKSGEREWREVGGEFESKDTAHWFAVSKTELGAIMGLKIETKVIEGAARIAGEVSQ